MKLTEIPFSFYSLEETDELGRTIKSKLQSNFTDNPLVNPMITDLTEPLHKSEKAIGSSTKQINTDKIKEIDQEFNRNFIGFRDIIYKHSNSPSTDHRAASETLKPILERNDDKLYNNSYAEQGAKFNSLDADLSSATATSALQTLNLSNWFNAMKTTISQMNQLIQERDQDQSGNDTPTDKQAKTELQNAITEVLEDLQTYNRRNTIDGLSPMLAEIDQVIKRINANARSRRTKKQGDS